MRDFCPSPFQWLDKLMVGRTARPQWLADCDGETTATHDQWRIWARK